MKIFGRLSVLVMVLVALLILVMPVAAASDAQAGGEAPVEWDIAVETLGYLGIILVLGSW